MDLQQFDQELRNFDWYYDMSDDPVVYTSGKTRFERLAVISKQSEQHSELFSKYYKEKHGIENL